MKTIEDFEKWAETYEYEYSRISNSTNWVSHTTPNGTIIEEIIIRGSILKPLTNYFTVCYNFPYEPEFIDFITKNKGVTRLNPYSEGKLILAEFDEFENAWLFVENQRDTFVKMVEKYNKKKEKKDEKGLSK